MKSIREYIDLLENIQQEPLPPETMELIDEYIAKVEPGADRLQIAQSIIDGSIHTSELEYALQDDLGDFDLSESKGDFSKAVQNFHGWYQDQSSDPNEEVYYFDDREGGYYADGVITHNLQTGEIKIDFEDKTGGEYGDDVQGTFNSIGSAINALRGITTQVRYNSGKAPRHDSLASKTLTGPDDLYKTDRAGKKGTLTKSRMDDLKASSKYTMRGGPKGVLPEASPDAITKINQLTRK